MFVKEICNKTAVKTYPWERNRTFIFELILRMYSCACMLRVLLVTYMCFCLPVSTVQNTPVPIKMYDQILL